MNTAGPDGSHEECAQWFEEWVVAALISNLLLKSSRSAGSG
jgi:hypothetical protein